MEVCASLGLSCGPGSCAGRNLRACGTCQHQSLFSMTEWAAYLLLLSLQQVILHCYSHI